MTIQEAMLARHSVRTYLNKPIKPETIAALQEEIDICNAESGLHLQLITDEPDAFGNFLAHYGFFRGVRNYIACVGKDDASLDTKVGYFGERIVLHAQQLGLNTCWVVMTYSKRKNRILVNEGEKRVCVIALGYGANQGHPHRNRPMEKLCHTDGPMPAWFRRGMEAAMLAPTAVNQQRFLLTLTGEHSVRAEATGGSSSKIDLGIVKYHFEQGAGTENFVWA